MFGPDNQSVYALDGNDRAGLERLRGQGASDLRLDPLPLIERPGEGCATAGAHGASEFERAARLIEPQAQSLRPADRPDIDRKGKPGLQQGFRAAARPHDILTR